MSTQIDIEDAIADAQRLTVAEFAAASGWSETTVRRAAERKLVRLSKDRPARVISGEMPMRMEEFERALRDGPLRTVSKGVHGFDSAKRVLAIVERNGRAHEFKCPETRATLRRIADDIARLDVARQAETREVVR